MRSIVLLGVLLFSGCTAAIELEDFNSDSWKQDNEGCNSTRLEEVQRLIQQKSSILGQSEARIIQTLGQPDRNHLFGRNQKTYYYYLTPSSDCPSHGDSSRFLHVRFNAVGIASELLVMEESNVED